MPEPAIIEDITVLDLSQGIPGAYCTKLLAALGARVIKVEPPEGDPTRREGPFFHDRPHEEGSGVFLYLNTSKESITLDPATVSGGLLLRRLVEEADVLVESYPPGTMDGWRLGNSELRALKPDLIYASITPFGQTGPYRDWKAGELVLEALGALLYPMGLREREPLKLGGSPSLYAGGISAFAAIMIALHARDLTGEGDYIDLSLQESTLITQIHSTIYSQMGNYDHGRRPGQLSRARDGWMNVGVQDASWKEFCAMIGRPELERDPRFIDMPARREHAVELNEVLNQWLADQDKTEAYHKLQALRSIAGYVADTSELLESEQLKARNFFQTVGHPATGDIAYPGAAFRIGGVPWRQERAPLLGEHNLQVYEQQLGLSREEIIRLRQVGAI